MIGGDIGLWLLLAAMAFFAAALAAVTGFGGAAVLLPVLVVKFGVGDAVPILTVAQLIGNAGRVWFNRRELNLRVVVWFALGAVPAAIVGGLLFVSAPRAVLTRFLGLFLLAMVAYRHLGKGKLPRLSARGFASLGAVSSFLSALVGSVGPLMAPFFLAYGLVKGAYIGTEALAAIIMHVSKLTVYGGTSLLAPWSVAVGLCLGGIMFLGSFVGKRIVNRVSERLFVLLVEATLIVAGLRFLIGG